MTDGPEKMPHDWRYIRAIGALESRIISVMAARLGADS
jgi:hypothetical protein